MSLDLHLSVSVPFLLNMDTQKSGNGENPLITLMDRTEFPLRHKPNLAPPDL